MQNAAFVYAWSAGIQPSKVKLAVCGYKYNSKYIKRVAELAIFCYL